MSKSKASNFIYTNKAEIAALKLTGLRLSETRELCGLTQTQAARLLNTSPQAIKDAENGKLNPLPIRLLKAAAEVYVVSADWLLNLSDDWEQGENVGDQRDLIATFHRSRVNHYSKLIAEQTQAENAT
ncbi:MULTISPECIES: helix-turn-helix domain-containing protein [Methylomonas]|uniref:HTH cro/C1-type domain-containing protein n=2 Tax=Methylomonas TaxID=416 RepID=A0A140E5F5_9GAMM